MELEVDVAVTWWTEHLERAGAAAHNEAFSRGPSVTTAEVNAFREAFGRALMVFLQPSWRPDDPTWGQGTRAFGVRYGPDDVLATAIDVANNGLGEDHVTYLPLAAHATCDSDQYRELG